MQRHLKNFYTKLVFKKIGKMSQLILQFMKLKYWTCILDMGMSYAGKNKQKKTSIEGN